MAEDKIVEEEIEVDGCACDIELAEDEIVDDRDLPAASGGVEQPAG